MNDPDNTLPDKNGTLYKVTGLGEEVRGVAAVGFNRKYLTETTK
jgi:hypothetical protein